LPLVICLLVLASCGRGADGVVDPSINEPQVEYPLVQGIYDLTAPITFGIPGAQYLGTINLVQSSRKKSGFGGDYAVQIVGPNGERSKTFTGTISGQVANSGAISFNFFDGSRNDHSWTGSLSGATISGTWIIRAPDGSSLSGTFTATRR
ncbi:MAG: hypothetical protein M3220_12845, partial [Chloroflexota bacterium]|nr:hypothetical protein [Chloroflexota bacterium]